MQSSYLWKHLSLIRVYSRLSIKKTLEYKFNVVTNTFAYIVLIFVWIYFWDLLFGKMDAIGEWRYPMLVLMLSFTFICDAIWQINYYTTAFFLEIVRGNFDLHLVRPVHPLFNMLMREFRFFPLIPAFFGFGLAIHTLITYFSFEIFNFIIALVICVIAASILGIIYSITSTLSFWFGNQTGIKKLFRSFLLVKRYPIDIFTISVQWVFTFLFPVYFFGTAQVLLLLESNIWISLKYLSWALIVFFAWIGLFTIIWRKGLTRYESNGG